MIVLSFLCVATSGKERSTVSQSLPCPGPMRAITIHLAHVRGLPALSPKLCSCATEALASSGSNSTTSGGAERTKVDTSCSRRFGSPTVCSALPTLISSLNSVSHSVPPALKTPGRAFDALSQHSGPSLHSRCLGSLGVHRDAC
ncbi:hypothetical protein BV20DRAFT_134815 [Pilatotrama ljubarskyi]|nr:hypothetical protein BV20DRAFT_134815 [Pilatotrama ljubarskyi]